MNDTHRGALLVGQDASAREDLRAALKERSTLLQETIEELQTTNEELHSANEELETTNEELQSANEELMTLNEEMQSTNEELETTNEELQSTNEELAAVNARLETSSTRVAQISKVLRTVADLCGNAMIVLDPQENVTLWSAKAREFFGQPEDEVVGRSIFGSNINVAADTLRQALREAQSTRRTIEIPGIQAPRLQGEPLHLAISVHVLNGDDQPPSGWVLTCSDTTPHERALEAARTATARYEAILAAGSDGVIVVDREGRVVEMNSPALKLLGDDKPAHLWDLASERAVMFQLKGALADMTTKHDTQGHAPHEFPVRTKSGRLLGLTLHAVGAPGAPPIVLVKALPK